MVSRARSFFFQNELNIRHGGVATVISPENSDETNHERRTTLCPRSNTWLSRSRVSDYSSPSLSCRELNLNCATFETPLYWIARTSRRITPSRASYSICAWNDTRVTVVSVAHTHIHTRRKRLGVGNYTGDNYTGFVCRIIMYFAGRVCRTSVEFLLVALLSGKRF